MQHQQNTLGLATLLQPLQMIGHHPLAEVAVPLLQLHLGMQLHLGTHHLSKLATVQLPFTLPLQNCDSVD